MPKRPSKPREKTAEDGMQRLTISIPQVLYGEVERIAKRDSRSMAWVIRSAIETRVKEESPLLFIQPNK